MHTSIYALAGGHPPPAPFLIPPLTQTQKVEVYRARGSSIPESCRFETTGNSSRHPMCAVVVVHIACDMSELAPRLAKRYTRTYGVIYRTICCVVVMLLSAYAIYNNMYDIYLYLHTCFCESVN